MVFAELANFVKILMEMSVRFQIHFLWSNWFSIWPAGYHLIYYLGHCFLWYALQAAA